MIARQFAGRLREQHLSPMPHVQQARHAIERRPHVIIPALFGHARVQRHANADREISDWRLEIALDLKRGGQGVGHGGKGGLKGIADHLVGVTAARRDRLANDGFVLREGGFHCLGVVLPQLGTALDVGEEERDRPTGPHQHRRFLPCSPVPLLPGPNFLVQRSRLRLGFRAQLFAQNPRAFLILAQGSVALARLFVHKH